MAVLHKSAPGDAAAAFARMAAGPEKSAAWLGLLDAACASGDSGAIRALPAGYGAGVGDRFQTHAGLVLVDAVGAGADPGAVAGAIAAVPWPVARQRVAGYHVRSAFMRGDKDLAVAIARALPDADARHALLESMVRQGAWSDESAPPAAEVTSTIDRLRAGRSAILEELAKLEPPVPAAAPESGKEDR
jgi:hypothetical protein